MNTYVLTIDPGLGGTGVGYWTSQHWGNPYQSYQSALVVHHDTKAVSLEEKLCSLSDRLRALWGGLDVVRALIEYPEYYETKGGLVTAESGSLVKLAVVTGHIICTLQSLPSKPRVVLVPPSSWKGQVTKKVMQQRVRPLLPVHALAELERKASHAWDAVGIGVWAQGVLG